MCFVTLSTVFAILRKTEQDIIKNVYWPSYCCQTVMKVEISRQIFEKHSNIKFHENPSSGSRVVACGRTDGQTDMAKSVAAFRNFANAPKKCFFVPRVNSTIRVRSVVFWLMLIYFFDQHANLTDNSVGLSCLIGLSADLTENTRPGKNVCLSKQGIRTRT